MAGASKDYERAHEFLIQTDSRADYICSEEGSHAFRALGIPANESFSDMATFDEREKSFEAKFKRDEELKFKATARRNKLLGLWAAEKMGLSGADAEAYAKEVVKADFERPGDEDVFEKVFGDFQAKGVDVSEHIVRKQMLDLLEDAVAQIQAGK